mmetsp:Transcript_12490/g.26337  ORF Transcript_12490/g.26337 Transcript_12490/m.26337 type:complete len:222 (-) Transcript_12490:1540-2205(-)
MVNSKIPAPNPKSISLTMSLILALKKDSLVSSLGTTNVPASMSASSRVWKSLTDWSPTQTLINRVFPGRLVEVASFLANSTLASTTTTFLLGISFWAVPPSDVVVVMTPPAALVIPSAVKPDSCVTSKKSPLCSRRSKVAPSSRFQIRLGGTSTRLLMLSILAAESSKRRRTSSDRPVALGPEINKTVTRSSAATATPESSLPVIFPRPSNLAATPALPGS